MKKILVTGANGFIGKHLLEALKEDSQYEVHAVTRDKSSIPNIFLNKENIFWYEMDLSNHHKIFEIVKFINPDICVHLAWATKPADYYNNLKINLQCFHDSLNVIEALLETQCKQLIIFGTYAEYSNAIPILNEDSFLSPNTIYAASKSSLYFMASQIVKNSTLNLCWARQFNTFGYYDDKNRLIPSLISSLYHKIEFKTSSGEQIRDFLYIKDVISAVLVLISNNAFGVYNISSGTGLKLKNLFLEIESLLDSKDVIKWNSLPERSWDPKIVIGESDKLKNLGWKANYSMRDGLLEMIDFYKNDWFKNDV